MSHDPRILVIGGTRGTGQLVVQSLLQQGQRVRVLARDPERAAARLGSGVQVFPGDLTKPETLPAAVQDVGHIIFTAGVPAGPARESVIVATEYEGVVRTLDAAREEGFSGRFVYMTSLGTTRRSVTAGLLNLVKRNTLPWRKRAEDDIRANGVDYTIIRAGLLRNAPAGKRAVEITQEHLPLAPRYRIGRADVAEAIVEALQSPHASNIAFDVVWGQGSRREEWSALFGRLEPDR